MMVKSINPSNHGQYNKYKKKVWVRTEHSNDVEIEIEVYDIEIIDELFISYDKNGRIIINSVSSKRTF